MLDCNYLCHRAYHTFTKLEHGGNATGVAFGFMRDIRTLQDQHLTNRFIFCWDHGRGLREQRTPTYKASRRANYDAATPEDKAGIDAFRAQAQRLRAKVLHALGWRNIFYADGYEADDVIASVVAHTIPKGDTAIIVSSDKDLYQLLRPGVLIWNPASASPVTHESFTKEYGVPPEKWPMVKAIAGCGTDDVIGAKGVGEATASKFLAGTLPKHYKAHQTCVMWLAFGHATRNLPLVQLPYPGCPVFALSEDEVTEDKWQAVANRMGFFSLLPQVTKGRQPTGEGLGFGKE